MLWASVEKLVEIEGAENEEALSHSKSDARSLSGDSVVVLRLTLRTAGIEAALLGAPVLARAAAGVWDLHVSSTHGSKLVRSIVRTNV